MSHTSLMESPYNTALQQLSKTTEIVTVWYSGLTTIMNVQV